MQAPDDATERAALGAGALWATGVPSMELAKAAIAAAVSIRQRAGSQLREALYGAPASRAALVEKVSEDWPPQDEKRTERIRVGESR